MPAKEMVVKFVRKQLWNLQRFGITPSGLRRRVLPGGEPPCLVVSLPKSGTHLVERAICLWPQYYRVIKPTIRKRNVEQYGGLPHLIQNLRAGQVLVVHTPYSEELETAIMEAGVKTVFACRDLRAVLASWTYHVCSLKTHRLHKHFKDVSDPRQRIRMILEGDPSKGYESMANTFRLYGDWLESPACEVVRFEELIGEAGGGSAETQQRSLNELWDHLNLPDDSQRRAAIRARVFSDASPTFRKGGKSTWREVFDDDLTTYFEEKTGGLMERYGYAPTTPSAE